MPPDKPELWVNGRCYPLLRASVQLDVTALKARVDYSVTRQTWRVLMSNLLSQTAMIRIHDGSDVREWTVQVKEQSGPRDSDRMLSVDDYRGRLDPINPFRDVADCWLSGPLLYSRDVPDVVASPPTIAPGEGLREDPYFGAFPVSPETREEMDRDWARIVRSAGRRTPILRGRASAEIKAADLVPSPAPTPAPEPLTEDELAGRLLE